MSSSLLAAGLLLFAVALAHSVMGERHPGWAAFLVAAVLSWLGAG
jgi:hypothetical protein